MIRSLVVSLLAIALLAFTVPAVNAGTVLDEGASNGLYHATWVTGTLAAAGSTDVVTLSPVPYASSPDTTDSLMVAFVGGGSCDSVLVQLRTSIDGVNWSTTVGFTAAVGDAGPGYIKAPPGWGGAVGQIQATVTSRGSGSGYGKLTLGIPY